MSKQPWRILFLFALAAATTLPAGAQERKTTPPKLLSVAETKLIMEGIVLPNYRGIDQRLQKKAADADAWTIVRGQSLLVAESGNLLMLRPPKNQGQDAWTQLATELRERGTEVARQAANRDSDKARTAYTNLTATCNKCHQTFQVQVRIGPPDGEER